MTHSSRRQFLRSAASATSAVALPTVFQNFLAHAASASTPPRTGYGPLYPVRDEVSGLPLLKVPKGFRYISHGWTGTQMSDGHRTPGSHDGMAVIAEDDGLLTLCRNHEVNGAGPPIGGPAYAYDPSGPGGCTNLEFDTSRQRFIQSWASLIGTGRNCAGGPTPWNTWLTCEETVLDPNEPDDRTDGNPLVPYEKSHGWVFEVPADGIAAPVPLKAMGRFVHEAVAVDPHTGIVYETEDRYTAGFFRFLPNEPEVLSQGGRLQMLKAKGGADLRGGKTIGQTWDVTWVDIEDPLRRHSPGTIDQQGVYRQGKVQGASTFARLEGCWQADDSIYFTATTGGAAQQGQVWQYRPREEMLTLVYESPGVDVLAMPDTMCVSPRGGLVLCEDADVTLQRLIGLTTDGLIFPLAENNMVLHGYLGHRGDFRPQEWAGATFSPDGQWLFVNIQTPGVTFAITGPWERGGI